MSGHANEKIAQAMARFRAEIRRELLPSHLRDEGWIDEHNARLTDDEVASNAGGGDEVVPHQDPLTATGKPVWVPPRMSAVATLPNCYWIKVPASTSLR